MIKILLGFIALVLTSWIVGYLIWVLKGRKTDLLKEADKVFNFFNYKIGLYLLLLVSIVFIIFILFS